MNREARNAIRRCERARKFPDNTCPASRAVFQLAEDISSSSQSSVHRDDARALFSVVEALWKARTEIDRLRKKLEGRP